MYPLVETLAGLAAAYLVLQFGVIVGPIYFAVFAGLVVITGVDLAIFEIPDEIVLPGIPLGLLATLVTPTTFTDAVIGVAIGAGVPYGIGKLYYLIMKREGMGFGDVKMLAMIGAFFGWKGVVAVLLVASIAGSVVGIGLVVFRGREARALIPFGPFLALGTLAYMLAGPEMIALYLRVSGH
ncbi:MAG: A24 family peptidase [Deltaproteobacteria bacterium]|nr:A24 family peptidase [Deltaproteobacteria bacterium]